MYFGCPLLRALNKTRKMSFFEEGNSGRNSPFVHAPSGVTAAGGRLWFGVSHWLFAACQRAKSAELQPCLGFRSHCQGAGGFVDLWKCGLRYCPPCKTNQRCTRGWPQEETGFSPQALLQSCRVGFELYLSPLYSAEQFAATCRSSSGHQFLPVPSPTPPQTSQH